MQSIYKIIETAKVKQTSRLNERKQDQEGILS